MHTKKVVFISGCSSGIGLATSVFLAQKGFNVVATMRNLKKSEKLRSELSKRDVTATLIELDVTKENSIQAAISAAMKEYGRIDILINNAGITIDGFIEDHSAKDIERVFRTNVFGVFNLSREVLPHMRKAGSGHIINMGSIAGQWALPQIGIYSSTKFAIEGFSEALRYEVENFGIKVSVVEPCFVNTSMVHQNRNIAAKSNSPESAYSEMNERCEKFYDDYGELHSIEPEEVAHAIYDIIRTKYPRARYMLGKRENNLRRLKKILPNRLFRKILRKNFPTLN